MAQPLKVSTLVTIDPSQAKQGGAEVQRVLGGMGDAAQTASSKIQQLIARSAGIGGVAANQNIREWTGALAMQGRSVDELRAKYSPLFAVINQYKTSLTEIRTLHAQGVLSSNEMTAAITRQRQATLASIDAIKGRNNAVAQGLGMGSAGQSFATANVAAQFQDIGVTAAMGMNPLMIALQQGTQLSTVIGQMDRPVAGLLAAFRSMVSPVSLVTIGLTAAAAAAIQYFTSAGSGAEEANGSLGKHEELVREVARKWGEAMPALKAYVDELDRASDRVDRQTASEAVAKKQLEGLGETLQELQPLYAAARRGLEGINADPVFIRDFGNAFGELRTKLDEGTASTEDMRRVQQQLQAGIDQFGTPALRDLGKAFDELAKQMDVAIGKAEQFRREAGSMELPRLDSISPLFSERGRLLTEEQFQPIGQIPVPTPRGTPELSGFPGERERLDAARERQKSIAETIADQRLELSLIGQSTAAIEAQRMEARLLADAKRDAERTGGLVSAEEIANIKEAAAEYGRLAQAIEAANTMRGMNREAERLQLEISLVGRGEVARRRALAVYEAEQKIKDIGMSASSREAQLMRSAYVAREEDRLELERLQDAWASVQDAGENAIDSISDALLSGDWKGALDGIAQDLSKTVLELGFSNPLKNALFGTNYGTLTDAGSIVSGMFGGSDTALGSSVGSMNVNAASVIINGGIAGAGALGQGLAGAAANQNLPGNMAAFAAAIKKLESGGNYQALGPVLQNGDRAYGAYQVMGSNLPSWTKGALGRVLSPDQFLASPAAQDAVFNKYFGQSLAKYGNANDAASVWFTGRPLSQGGNAADILGTTGKAYVEKFNAALGQVTNTASSANQSLGLFGNNLGTFGNSLQKAVGGIGSGGGGVGGFLNNIFGSLFSPQWSAALSGSIVGLFDRGGYTGPGARQEPAGVVHKGEVVWSQDDVARAGGWQTVEAMRLGRRGYSAGGAVGMAAASQSSGNSGKPSIVVHNYSSAKVEAEESTDEWGNRQTSFTISDAVGQALDQKGGRARKSMASGFGVRPRGRMR